MIPSPRRLYKYLPEKYVDEFVSKGHLLFRSLSYFQKVEFDAARGDVLEGMHLDHPPNPVRLTNMTTGRSTEGNFGYINKIESEKVYCYCLSTLYSPDLYAEFGCGMCIEIIDVPEFLTRIQRKVNRFKSAAAWRTLSRSVEYYERGKAATSNIKEPTNLAFFKNSRFRNQSEYRVAVGRNENFKLTQQIADMNKFDFEKVAKALKSSRMSIKLGSLVDLVLVHRK